MSFSNATVTDVGKTTAIIQCEAVVGYIGHIRYEFYVSGEESTLFHNPSVAGVYVEYNTHDVHEFNLSELEPATSYSGYPQWEAESGWVSLELVVFTTSADTDPDPDPPTPSKAVFPRRRRKSFGIYAGIFWG